MLANVIYDMLTIIIIFMDEKPYNDISGCRNIKDEVLGENRWRYQGRLHKGMFKGKKLLLSIIIPFEWTSLEE